MVTGQDFMSLKIKEIQGYINVGESTEESLEKAGAEKHTDASGIYYIPYGLNDDKALFFEIKQQD